MAPRLMIIRFHQRHASRSGGMIPPVPISGASFRTSGPARCRQENGLINFCFSAAWCTTMSMKVLTFADRWCLCG